MAESDVVLLFWSNESIAWQVTPIYTVWCVVSWFESTYKYGRKIRALMTTWEALARKSLNMINKTICRLTGCQISSAQKYDQHGRITTSPKSVSPQPYRTLLLAPRTCGIKNQHHKDPSSISMHNAVTLHATAYSWLFFHAFLQQWVDDIWDYTTNIITA